MGIKIDPKPREVDPKAVDRLISEVRQVRQILDGVKKALYTYPDLSRMSVEGAIEYLIRHKHVLDEIKEIVDRGSSSPTHSHSMILRIEEICKNVD